MIAKKNVKEKTEKEKVDDMVDAAQDKMIIITALVAGEQKVDQMLARFKANETKTLEADLKNLRTLLMALRERFKNIP